MSKAILVYILFLSGLTTAVADQIETPSVTSPKDDMSRKAAFDEACADAVALVANSYFDHKPPSARATANIKMCNGHPSRIICETASQVMLREFEKNAFHLWDEYR
jgi:hypothetical protein